MADFQELIEGLSDKVNRELQIDKHGCISLQVKDHIVIQIEQDEREEKIIIAAYIEELPPGKFREHILRDSLKANILFGEKHSILSYMKKENYLMIHQKFEKGLVDFESFYQAVQNISTRALLWYEAIDNGRSCPDEEIAKKQESNGNIYGMK